MPYCILFFWTCIYIDADRNLCVSVANYIICNIFFRCILYVWLLQVPPVLTRNGWLNGPSAHLVALDAELLEASRSLKMMQMSRLLMLLMLRRCRVRLLLTQQCLQMIIVIIDNLMGLVSPDGEVFTKLLQATHIARGGPI